MAIPIAGKTNIHWVDRIVIEIRSLEVEGESFKLASVKFYSEDSVYDQFEVTAFTLHEDVRVKVMEKKQLIKILIDKKEGKNGRRKKE